MIKEYIRKNKWNLAINGFIVASFYFNKDAPFAYYSLLFVLCIEIIGHNCLRYLDFKTQKTLKEIEKHVEDQYLKMIKDFASEISYPEWPMDKRREALSLVQKMEKQILKSRARVV